MTARWPIPRPTEHAAIRAVTASPRALPSMPALFAALVTACGMDDQHGMNLFGHAIARTAGTEANR